ncbi:MAG TPA: hypothetical protein PLC12_00790 [Candidatus Methanofastidiosa archaeon]|nr:hypothetical protein [Candidatus Methanofastidiosa archaeon]
MISMIRCQKCKKWFSEDEMNEEQICESCQKKEEMKRSAEKYTGDDIKTNFLNYIERSGATSLATLAKKYKNKVNEEESMEALEELVKEGKLAKRESKNKKGKYVYEILKE